LSAGESRQEADAGGMEAPGSTFAAPIDHSVTFTAGLGLYAVKGDESLSKRAITSPVMDVAYENQTLPIVGASPCSVS
jgi:hypothetical protein